MMTPKDYFLLNLMSQSLLKMAVYWVLLTTTFAVTVRKIRVI